jgi:hypothetical protein
VARNIVSQSAANRKVHGNKLTGVQQVMLALTSTWGKLKRKTTIRTKYEFTATKSETSGSHGGEYKDESYELLSPVVS